MHRKRRCEGCKKEYNVKYISWFLGHWLCGSCRRRNKMPLVGYKTKVVWKTEKKLMGKVKKRFMPYLTWHEKQVLWKDYMRQGLSPKQAKNRITSLSARISKSHWSHQTKEVPNE